MDADDTVEVICAPWSEELLRRLPGNRTAMCDRCSGPVVISREALAVGLGGRIVCLPCAKRENPDMIAKAVPGAFEAARRAGLPIDERDVRAAENTPLREWADDEPD